MEQGEVIDYFWPGELGDVYADGSILRQDAADGTPHVHSVELVVAAPARLTAGRGRL